MNIEMTEEDYEIYPEFEDGGFCVHCGCQLGLDDPDMRGRENGGVVCSHCQTHKTCPGGGIDDLCSGDVFHCGLCRP